LFNVDDVTLCNHFGVKLFSPEHERVMQDIFDYFAVRRIQPGNTVPVSFRSQDFLWMGELDPELRTHWKYKAIRDSTDPGHKIIPPYSDEAVAYWERWARWWRGRGLPLGAVSAGMLHRSKLEEHPEYVRRFLQAYSASVRRHGWDKHCYIRYPDEMDEPGKQGIETAKQCGSFVRKYGPNLRLQSVQTARTPQEPYLEYVDLWFVYRASYERERELYERLRREGKTFWMGIHNHIGVDVPDVAPRLFFTTGWSPPSPTSRCPSPLWNRPC